MFFVFAILLLVYQTSNVFSICDCQFEEKRPNLKHATCLNVSSDLFCDAAWDTTQSLKIVEPFVLEELSPILSAFENASKIISLDLSANNITKVDLNTFHRFKLLSSLNLSHNPNISFIPNHNSRENFNLKEIILEHNNMTSISGDFFGNCTNLTYLDLSFNRINRIEGDLSSVTILILKNNNLTLLKGDFFQNVSFLRHLNLQWNKLSDVHPDAFKNLVYLGNLDLSHNHLYSVHYQTFIFSPLIFLNLSHNQIDKELDSRLFLQNVTTFQNLDLSYNNIKSIQETSFSSLKYLISLNLSHNDITAFHKHAFQRLPALEELYLNGNKIKEFSIDDLVNSSKSLAKINLDHNPWNCQNLSRTLRICHRNGVSVFPGKNNNDTNVFGIACLNYAKEDFNEIVIEKIGVTIVRIEIFIIILIVFVIFGALYTIFYQLYANYRSRNIEEGFELLQTT